MKDGGACRFFLCQPGLCAYATAGRSGSRSFRVEAAHYRAPAGFLQDTLKKFAKYPLNL